MAGQPIANLMTTEDLAPFNSQTNPGGVINCSLTTGQRDNIRTNTGTAVQSIQARINYTFSDGTTIINYWNFAVNNNAYPRVRTDAEITNIANARAAAVAGPVIIVSNIAAYDATQNRFEDSSGDEVVVPNGVIVTLAQSVYDAAVADSDFTPNANAIFLTR